MYSSFRGADYGTHHYLVVSKVRERWAVINKQDRNFMGKDLF